MKVYVKLNLVNKGLTHGSLSFLNPLANASTIPLFLDDHIHSSTSETSHGRMRRCGGMNWGVCSCRRAKRKNIHTTPELGSEIRISNLPYTYRTEIKKGTP